MHCVCAAVHSTLTDGWKWIFNHFASTATSAPKLTFFSGEISQQDIQYTIRKHELNIEYKSAIKMHIKYLRCDNDILLISNMCVSVYDDVSHSNGYMSHSILIFSNKILKIMTTFNNNNRRQSFLFDFNLQIRILDRMLRKSESWSTIDNSFVKTSLLTVTHFSQQQ